MTAKQLTINVGDRVELANSEASSRLPNMNNGIVVKYLGEHDPENPRVRWESGWGVSSKSKDLRLMTAEETSKLSTPMILDIDK